jgi:hypothetical protein
LERLEPLEPSAAVKHLERAGLFGTIGTVGTVGTTSLIGTLGTICLLIRTRITITNTSFIYSSFILYTFAFILSDAHEHVSLSFIPLPLSFKASLILYPFFKPLAEA